MSSYAGGSYLKKLLLTARESAKDKGIGYLVYISIYACISIIKNKTFGRGKPFSFNGKNYHYFHSIISKTWDSERAVEVPIAMDFIKKYEGKRILEVGNVLSNYYHFKHDIVDKYEVGEGIINEDIVNFHSPERYDLIISVSTLEHVGWDENPRDSTKILHAIQNLKQLAKPSGTIVVTLPLGYNSNMDTMLRDRTLQFTEQYYLLRTTKSSWKQASWEDVQGIKYGDPFPAANALVIGIIFN